MTLYTLAVSYRVHDAWSDADAIIEEIVNPEWRGPFHVMDREASRLNTEYLEVGRRYRAIAVDEARYLDIGRKAVSSAKDAS